MKQKDIAMILGCAGFSAIVAFAIATFVIGGPQKNLISVKIIDPITSEFLPPDEKFFNKESLNPTQTVEIKPSDNKAPFKQ